MPPKARKGSQKASTLKPPPTPRPTPVEGVGSQMLPVVRYTAKQQPRPRQQLASEVIVTQQHSLELIKVAITATFSHIVKFRGVFKFHFDIRRYDPNDPRGCYEPFIDGSLADADFEKTAGLQNWFILPRGRDPRADKLLDSLLGAQDALEKGFLAKIQLSFHHNDDEEITSNNLIEAYSMAFEYRGGEPLPQISTTVDVRSSSCPSTVALVQTSPVLYDSKIEIRNLVDAVVDTLRTCKSPLPETYRMSIALSYNIHAPCEYLAPTFKPGNKHTDSMMASEMLEPVKAINSGFHDVVFALATPPLKLPSIRPDSGKESILSQASHPQASPVGVSSSLEAPQTYQPHAIFNTQDNQTQLEGFGSLSGLRSMESLQYGAYGIAPANVPQSSSDLQRHVPPVGRPKTEELVNLPPYTQSILNYAMMIAEDGLSSQYVDDLDEPETTQEAACQDAVKCECRVLTIEDTMMKCVKCKELRHRVCYGFTNNDLYDSVICYTCFGILQGDRERFEHLSSLCVIRRTLCFFQTKKTVGFQSIAKHLGPQNDASQILKNLEHEGLIKSHTKTIKGKKAVVSYSILGKNSQRLREVSRPQFMISDLFQIPGEFAVDSGPRSQREGANNNHMQGPRVASQTHSHLKDSTSIPKNPQQLVLGGGGPSGGENGVVACEMGAQQAYSTPRNFRQIAGNALNDDTSTQFPSPEQMSVRSSARSVHRSRNITSRTVTPLCSKKRQLETAESEDSRSKRIRTNLRSPFLF